MLARDVGPFTKYPKPAEIERAGGNNAIVLIVDDDQSYGHTMVEALLGCLQKHPSGACANFARDRNHFAPGVGSVCGRTLLLYPLMYAVDGLMFCPRLLGKL